MKLVIEATCDDDKVNRDKFADAVLLALGRLLNDTPKDYRGYSVPLVFSGSEIQAMATIKPTGRGWSIQVVPTVHKFDDGTEYVPMREPKPKQ